MTDNWSTAPYPGASGDYVYTPKLIGQQAKSRQELSLWSSSPIGISIQSTDGPIDPDNDDQGNPIIELNLYIRTDFTNPDPLGPDAVIESSDLIREEQGIWSFVLGPDMTSQPCLITAMWTYTVDGLEYNYTDYFQIVEPMPTFDSLTEEEKDVCKRVAFMFEDLWDSTEGGPYLREPFQTKFGMETIARCLYNACDRLNTDSQPYTFYKVGPGQGDTFPGKYYGILVRATYLEVVRHLVRSYTEQPTLQGNPGVAELDRTQYANYWRAILQDEKEDFAKAVRAFKRSTNDLGGGQLIVAGGWFGRMGSFRPGMQAMASRAGRFYPPSYVVVR